MLTLNLDSKIVKFYFSNSNQMKSYLLSFLQYADSDNWTKENYSQVTISNRQIEK